VSLDDNKLPILLQHNVMALMKLFNLVL